LCNEEDISIIKGNWDYDNSTCTLENTDSGIGNIVWFGDGTSSPDSDYSFNNFIFTVGMILHANEFNAGVLFRTTSVSTINDGGQQYYVGLLPLNDGVQFGIMDDGFTQLNAQYGSITIDVDIEYQLKIIAQDGTYTVYVDGTQIMNVTNSQYTSGSIGLRSFKNPVTYTYATLQEIDNSNILCNGDDISIVKGSWDYDNDSCTLNNTDSGTGNIAWFGDGTSLPDTDYSFSSFILTVGIIPHGSQYDAGVLFRATSVSTINDYGQQYYVGLSPAINRVQFTLMDDSATQLAFGTYSMSAGLEYQLKIIALGTTYTVYIDGNQVLSVTNSLFTTGSIGFRSFRNPVTYTYVKLEQIAAESTVTSDEQKSLISEYNKIVANSNSDYATYIGVFVVSVIGIIGIYLVARLIIYSVYYNEYKSIGSDTPTLWANNNNKYSYQTI